eukprot:m.101467 g.101467  ORF g.101467 m.101467 type:complete len:335 (+) comp8968_c0_seq2:66-1070(+)
MAESVHVCVTGASGFIASHCVQQLLAKGYVVHGTVRNCETASFLRDLEGAAERLKLFEADLLQDGAFDEALAGCTYVLHTASPFQRKIGSPDELLKPAIRGTQAVLEACARVPSVKRVVVTSSFATIIFGHDHTTDPTPYTEEEWNNVSTLEMNNNMHTYRVSKREAERAAWQFVEKEQPQFDVVTIHPPLVIGPFVPGYARPNESSMIIKEYLAGEVAKCPDGGMAFVDVRDVAAMHVAAMERPAAKGRYLVSSGTCTFLEMCQMLRQMFPSCSVPLEKADGNALPPFIDSSKAKRDLGFVERPIEESLRIQTKALLSAGLLPASAMSAATEK